MKAENCKCRLHTRDGQAIKVINSHNHERLCDWVRVRKKKKRDDGATQKSAVNRCNDAGALSKKVSETTTNCKQSAWLPPS